MANWERSFPEPESFNGPPGPEDGPGRRQSYVCADCAWHGLDPLYHYVQTGHAVRGRHWPLCWPNCRWTDSDADGRRVTPKE